jgi:predicted transglutaminase-like cysteine proteinase
MYQLKNFQRQTNANSGFLYHCDVVHRECLRFRVQLKVLLASLPLQKLQGINVCLNQ